MADIYFAGDTTGSEDAQLHLLDSVMHAQSDKPFCVISMVGQSDPIHTSVPDDNVHRVLQPKLKLEVSQAGSLTFTILPDHPLYEKLEQMKTRVTCTVEGVELFRGRVVGWTTDVNLQKSVTCEGDLGYLLDTVQKIGKKFAEGKTVSKALSSFISGHNAMVGKNDPRRFELGSVSKTLASKKFYKDESQDYEQTRSLIDELLDNFGGYIRTSVRSGKTKIDYLYDYTDDRTDDNPIVFGRNLITFSQDVRADDLFTVLIPEGENPKPNRAANEDGEEEKLDISGQTLSSASFKAIGSTYHFTVSGKELRWDEGIQKYGRIVRAQTFQGLKESGSKKDLLSMARRFFRDNICTWEGALTVTAVDLRYLNNDVQPIRLGSYVRVRIPAVTTPSGKQVGAYDKKLICLSIEYDLAQPSATNYTFGWPYKPLSGRLAKKVEKAEQKAEKAEKSAKKAGGGARRNSQGLDEHEDYFDVIQKECNRLRDDIANLHAMVTAVHEVVDTWTQVTAEIGVESKPDSFSFTDGSGNSQTINYIKEVTVSIPTSDQMIVWRGKVSPHAVLKSFDSHDFKPKDPDFKVKK